MTGPCLGEAEYPTAARDIGDPAECTLAGWSRCPVEPRSLMVLCAGERFLFFSVLDLTLLRCAR